MSPQAYSTLRITDLPEDILYLIIQYLPLTAFLSFCRSCKTFQHNQDLRFSASYWSRLTRNTFRLPSHPVVAHNGRRWMSLYRRMRTQTMVYTWGNNDGGCLGGEMQIQGPRVARPRVGMAGGRFFGVRTEQRLRRQTWPGEMKTSQWGTISDLQCGGWSTTALNSHGALFTIGLIDAVGSPHMFDSPVGQQLEYPPGYTQPTALSYDPFTAIRQFSSGRRHILALSDSGRIWCWDDKNRPSLHIKFLTIDLVEGQSDGLSNVDGRVTKVVAGWDRSSAYIVGKGIVLWVPSNIAELQGQSDQSTVDGMLVLESWTVPLSTYRNSPTSRAHVSSSGGSIDDAGEKTGEVTNWIVLSKFIVFTTTTGRLFISRFSDYDTSAPSSICLNAHHDLSQSSTSGEYILDIQGAHQHFAVFKRDGTVLISTEDRLHEIWEAHHTGRVDPPRQPFSKVPCLQNTGVISLAFGDHHYHALHSDGTITSYGRELAECGALGLGGDVVAPIRGLTRAASAEFLHDDNMILAECCDTGRRVFFDGEKKDWLKWMAEGVLESREVVERRSAQLELSQVKAEVSEWVEERLRHWDLEVPWTEHHEEQNNVAENEAVDRAADADDGLPAYFALNVAAAGWHSAALVLVNEDKAQRERARCLGRADSAGSRSTWIWEDRKETFPKLRLKNGEILGQINAPRSKDAGITDLPEWLRQRDWRPIEQVDL